MQCALAPLKQEPTGCCDIHNGCRMKSWDYTSGFVSFFSFTRTVSTCLCYLCPVISSRSPKISEQDREYKGREREREKDLTPPPTRPSRILHTLLSRLQKAREKRDEQGTREGE